MVHARAVFSLLSKKSPIFLAYIKKKSYLCSDFFDKSTKPAGADMKVDFINDGPVTILLDTEEL